MLSTLAKLELQFEGRTYQFLCNQDAPTGHVKEALFQFQKYVGMVEDQAKAAQESSSNNASAADTAVSEQARSPEG